MRRACVGCLCSVPCGGDAARWGTGIPGHAIMQLIIPRSALDVAEHRVLAVPQ